MGSDFDVIVGGGSIAGLAFAAEAAKKGLSVLVSEEHSEIGEPEKCDGLVSLRGLRALGYLPGADVIQNEIATGLIHSPLGKSFAVNASSLEVVVLDRSAFDQQVASEAASRGAKIMTGTRATGYSERKDGVSVKAGDDDFTAKYYVDATGPSSSPRGGILPAAKYEIEADWIRERVVEVFLDAEKYPGFFAWVIPYGKNRAKVGAAGTGISPFKALDGFLADKPHEIIRKVSAPIYIGGPTSQFVKGRRILVGESAGQVKPTTAGGIMTSIAGAVAAAHWVGESLRTGKPELLANYQRQWESGFIKEMKTMLRLRGVFAKLSNNDLDALVATLATPKVVLRLSQTDFDYHGSALLAVLGLPGLLRVAKVVASAELRSLVAEG